MTRRVVVLIVAAGLAVAACGAGDDEGGGSTDGSALADVQLLSTAERAEPAAATDLRLAGDATTTFGAALLGAALDRADPGANVVVSPLSVALVLAMTEPGAVGDAQAQLRALLTIEDPGAFHESLSALEQRLTSLALEAPPEPDQDPGELTLDVADAAYLQDGYPFEDVYLDAIGRLYGPVLRGVDYAADPDAVAHEINRFVSDVTHERIPELIADGVLKPETVLTLVNALYLKASWLEPFEASDTAAGPFTRTDGTEVSVPFLHGTSGSAIRGDGWVAATKPYVGGLEAQLVLPDDGRMEEVLAELPAVVEEIATRRGPEAPLALPRFETRFRVELSAALQALGLVAPFEPGGLLGIAADDRLVLSQVVHETYLAVDEEGTEAAAATAATFDVTSAPIDEPVPVVLDRPFVLRIVDPASDATLFLGLINDPTA